MDSNIASANSNEEKGRTNAVCGLFLRNPGRDWEANGSARSPSRSFLNIVIDVREITILYTIQLPMMAGKD